MDTTKLIDIFLVIFIGMGPIKVLLVYIAMTEGMEREVRRQVARRTVLVAGAVALGLFALGAFLQALLHFSIGALTIFGGLILLILALNLVLSPAKKEEPGAAPDEAALMGVLDALYAHGARLLSVEQVEPHPTNDREVRKGNL